MKVYKVYRGLTFVKGKQVVTLVTTKTKKKAKELLSGINVSAYEFDNYWSETGNPQQVEIGNKHRDSIYISFTNAESSES